VCTEVKGTGGSARPFFVVGPAQGDEIREFADENADSLASLKTWHKIAGQAKWLNIADVKAVYPHADAVGKCTVFNIGGNDFRLVVQIDFRSPGDLRKERDGSC
jgi:mRNA-degrading endonuclease HigB of HigAB toxin-antitoxin module